VTTATADASYAAEVARLLWPDPWAEPFVTREPHRKGMPHRDAYLFPSERRPRILVPADLPGSSQMLRRLGAGGSRLAVPVRALLERSVRSRAFGLTRWPILRVPAGETGADSIETHLSDCFGTEVRVGIMLGTRRVNQKPVLQVFDLAGRLRGYAKVGHNALTAGLVRREARALEVLNAATLVSLQVPRLIGSGQWSGLQVLVMSALMSDPGAHVAPADRLTAMREVARLAGVTPEPLLGSHFWTRLRAEIDGLGESADYGRLVMAADSIEDRHGAATLDMGAWHGDWGEWNMGTHNGVLQVWDWERFDPAVPLGFDGLHHLAQSIRPGQRHAARQEAQFHGSVRRTLTRHGVLPDRHDLTLDLYLLEMAVRYVDALTHGATPPLRRRTDWVLSQLEGRLQSAPANRSEGRP
jgi:hypothetical protein